MRFRPDGTRRRIRAPRAGDLRARRRDEGARCRRRRARSPKSARAPTGRRFRAVHAARAIAADAADRPRRPQLRLRARAETARRGAHPAAARRRRRRADRARALRARPRSRSSAASRNCAAPTTRSPASPSIVGGRCCTASAAASSACCGCCARALARGGRRWSRARRRRRCMALALARERAAAWFDFDTAQSTWRRSGRSRSALAVLVARRRRPRATRSCSWRPRACRAARFPQHPQLWRLWSRDGRAVTPQVLGRTVGGYLFVPIELALDRRVLLRDQPLARLVAAVRNADRSQHPRQRVPALTPIAHVAAGGIHGGVPVPRGAAVARRAASARASVTAGSGIAIAFVLQALVFGARARQLSRLSVVLAAGRARRAVDGLGADLPALRPAADDPAARAVRPRRCCRFRCSWSRRRAPAATQALVIAAGLVPLAIVLARRRARRRVGRACPRPCATRAWQPPRRAGGRRAAARPRRGRRVDRARAARAAAARACRAWPLDRVHAACSATCRRCRSIAPQAEARADAALAQRGVKLGPGWRRFSVIRARRRRRGRSAMAQVRLARGGPRRVSRAGRQRARAAAVGSALCALRRRRCRRARRGVARHRRRRRQRAAGAAPAARSAAGRELSREQARVARAAGDRGSASDSIPATLRETSAEEQARPARTDWPFAFADPARRRRQGRRGARDRRRSPATRSSDPGATSSCPRRGSAPSASATSRLQSREERDHAGADRRGVRARSSRRSSPGAAGAATSARFWLALRRRSARRRWSAASMPGPRSRCSSRPPSRWRRRLRSALRAIALSLVSADACSRACWRASARLGCARARGAGRRGVGRLWLRGASARAFRRRRRRRWPAPSAAQDLPLWPRYTIESAGSPWLDALRQVGCRAGRSASR